MTGSPAFERYARDGALVLGGPAAILLQVADPIVAHGVAAHSGFAADPMRRLRHTLRYVYAVSIGAPDQRNVAGASVERAHTGIPGATDPARQLWVAATLYRTGADVYELLRGAMPTELADEVYAASARLGTTLQVPPEFWPTDRAAFDRYWTDAVAALDVGDDARAVARDLLHPRNVPLWVRAGMPLGRTLTAGLLPASIRDAYGLPHRPRAFARAVRAARLASHLVPRRVRELPSHRLLAP